MKGRCRVCGTVVSGVTICNSCSLAYADRRFVKMVNREELDSTLQILNRRKKSRQTSDVVDAAAER
jgi:hypothetical protein